MKCLMTGLVVAAGLHSGFAGAQADPISSHAGHAAAPAAPAAPAKKPDSPASKPGAANDYRSPLADYRPFTSKEPQKGWREANDEVRSVGGHIGLMKGAPGSDSAGTKDGKP